MEGNLKIRFFFLFSDHQVVELGWVMRGSENVSPIIHLLLSNWKITSEIQHYTENWHRNGSVRATLLRFVSALSSSNNISSLLCQNTFVANIWTRTQSLLKQQNISHGRPDVTFIIGTQQNISTLYLPRPNTQWDASKYDFSCYFSFILGYPSDAVITGLRLETSVQEKLYFTIFCTLPEYCVI